MLILSALTHGVLAAFSAISTLASAASSPLISSSSLFGVLLGVLALASIAGVVIAYAKVSFTQATVRMWREQSEALEARLTEMEKSSAEKDVRLKKQDDEIALLKEMVSGGNAIKALGISLGEKMDQHHEALMKVLKTGGTHP